MVRQRQKKEEEDLWSELATPSKHPAPDSDPQSSLQRSSIPVPVAKAAATTQPPVQPQQTSQQPAAKPGSFLETATREELVVHVQKQTVLLKKSKGKSDGSLVDLCFQ